MKNNKYKTLSEKIEKDLENAALKMCDALEFMMQLVEEDTKKFREYHAKYGDIKYRAIDPESGDLGDPTQIDLVMKAESIGMSVKRVIDTLATINNKLTSLEETSDDEYSGKEEKEHQEDINEKAKKLLEASKLGGKND